MQPKPYLVALLLLAACNKKEPSAPPLYPLAGNWQQRPTTMLYAGTHYRITLRNDDTFLMKLYRFTDIIWPGRPCLEPHYDYVKGHFSDAGGMLTFKGRFYDSLYQGYSTDCMGTDTFYEEHPYVLKAADSLLLNHTMNAYSQILLYRD